MATYYPISGSWRAPSFRTIAGANCSSSSPCQLELTFNCDATAGYFADSILIETKPDFLTNNKTGDLGSITTWLGTMVPENWLYQPDENYTWEQLDSFTQNSYLMLWFYQLWQNTENLNNMTGDEKKAYLSIAGYLQDQAYSCDGKRICAELEIRGDPDVSGRGVSHIFTCLVVEAIQSY